MDEYEQEHEQEFVYNHERAVEQKIKSSFEYMLIKRYQKTSDDPFVKSYDTEEMYFEYEWSLRMFWLNKKDSYSYEELDVLLFREIGKYFEIEKQREPSKIKKNKSELIAEINSYFQRGKEHTEKDLIFQQILKHIDVLRIKRTIRSQFIVEHNKKEIIKNGLTAFFLKSNWEDKEWEIENAIKVIEEIGE